MLSLRSQSPLLVALLCGGLWVAPSVPYGVGLLQVGPMTHSSL